MGAYWLCLIFCVVAVYFSFFFSVSGEVTVV